MLASPDNDYGLVENAGSMGFRYSLRSGMCSVGHRSYDVTKMKAMYDDCHEDGEGRCTWMEKYDTYIAVLIECTPTVSQLHTLMVDKERHDGQ